MALYSCRYLARKSDVSFDKPSSRILEKIATGEMMERAHISAVGDTSGRGDAIGTCTASCERDGECFAVHVSADSCLHFRRVDV